MDKPDEAVAELVARMKAAAREHAAVPLGPPPRDCYYNFANGLKLCLTVDILTAEWVNAVARLAGIKSPEVLVKGAKFWHLSIARMVAGGPLPAELEFWRRAFFEEAPFVQTPGVLPGIYSRHFFWKYE